MTRNIDWTQQVRLMFDIELDQLTPAFSLRAEDQKFFAPIQEQIVFKESANKNYGYTRLLLFALWLPDYNWSE